MFLHIVVVGHFRIQGRVNAPAEQQFKGLVQIIHAGNLCAVLLCQLGIGAADGVGGVLALKILQRMDGIVVAAHNDRRAVVGIRGGKVVFFAAFLGNVHAVDHNVIAPGIQTRQQTVPFALHKGGGNAQLFGNFGADLHIVADQIVVFIVVGPRRPGTLHGDNDGAALLDAGKLILAGGFGLAAAACQNGSHTGGEQQGGHFSSKYFHNKLLCL